MKILIVDDSILIRRSLVRLLDQLDCSLQIVEAVNAPEGIRIAMELLPDVVILDIRMPGGSGFDVLREVKRAANPPIAIILSKYSTEKFREEAASAGADHFLDKSTEFEKVIEIIQAFNGN